MKVLTIILIVLGVLVLVGAGVFAYIEFKPHKFQLNLVTQSTGAACLDGTAPGYYIRKGKGDGKNKYVIFFQGGSWCEGETQNEILDSCFKILGTDLGGSKNWPKTKEFGGILSNSKSDNPDFYNWNHVVINYCDGAFHQGYVKNPFVYQGKNINFKGELNTKEILNELQGKHGLNQASDVILAGFDSGVTAVYNWADYIKANYLNTNAKYNAIADSGYYVDFMNYKTENYKTRYQIQALHSIVDAETSVPSEQCKKGLIQSNQWQCLFPQYISRFVSTPLFIVQSFYDIWVLQDNAGLDCLSEKTSSLDTCMQIQDELQTYKRLLASVIMKNVQKNQAIWQIACAFHDKSFTTSSYYTSSNWQVPAYSSSMTVQAAFSKWLNDKTKNLYIDGANWPDNTKCARINF